MITLLVQYDGFASLVSVRHLIQSSLFFSKRFITAHIRRMRERNSSSLSILAGGGVTPVRLMGEGACFPGQDRVEGYPIPGQDRGCPFPGHGRRGLNGDPSPIRTGRGYPPLSRLDGVCNPPPPHSKETGWGTPSPSRRSGDRTATRQVVCLLRSRRRTFLFCFDFKWSNLNRLILILNLKSPGDLENWKNDITILQVYF